MSVFGDSGLGPEPEGQTDVDPGNQPPQQEEVKLSGYAQNYLQGVPEAERELVQRHISKWDTGASQQFQRYAEELNRWKGLGNYDDLVAANRVYQQLVSDPQGVVDYLYKEHGYTPSELAAMQQQAQATGPGQQQAEPQPWEPQLKQYESRFQQYDRVLGGIAEYIKQQKEAAETQQYDKQVDDLLTQVKSVDKTIPDNYALTLMLQGRSPEQVAAQWKQEVQAALNAQRNGQPSPAPGLMGARSGGPVAQKATDMTDDQRRQALSAAVLQAFGE